MDHLSSRKPKYKKKPRGRNEKGTRLRAGLSQKKWKKSHILRTKKRQCFGTDGCVSLHYFCKKWYLVSMHTNHVIKKTHAHGATHHTPEYTNRKKNASFIADRVYRCLCVANFEKCNFFHASSTWLNKKGKRERAPLSSLLFCCFCTCRIQIIKTHAHPYDFLLS